MSKRKSLRKASPLENLRNFTPARVALGHVGHSLPTQALLNFQLDHARARDAVHSALDFALLSEEISRLGFSPVRLKSRAETKDIYLREPDRGRRLSQTSLSLWKSHASEPILVVIGDGLSPRAIQTNGVSVLAALKEELGPQLVKNVPLVEHARVAIGDEIASLAGAQLILLLIGERPGMSSAANISIYMTYRPAVGTTDEARNCISNIGGPGGFSCLEAANKAAYLARKALVEGRTGVQLKDDQ